MSRMMITLTAALFVTVLGGLVPVLSQDMGGKAEPEAKDPWAAWTELQKPGEPHKMLAESVGEWTIEGKMFHMDGEKVVEMPANGKSTMKMLWGRYLQEEMAVECPMMKMTMNMRGYIGYDNSAKEHQCVYFGDMGTELRVFKGTFDEKAGAMTFSAEWTEKGMGDMKRKSRVVSAAKSKDESTVTIYETMGDNPEFKMMEMTYKRKK